MMKTSEQKDLLYGAGDSLLAMVPVGITYGSQLLEQFPSECRCCKRRYALMRAKSGHGCMDPPAASTDIYQASAMKYSAHITQAAFTN